MADLTNVPPPGAGRATTIGGPGARSRDEVSRRGDPGAMVAGHEVRALPPGTAPDSVTADRLAGITESDIPVSLAMLDGDVEVVDDPQEPEVGALRDRIKQEGRDLLGDYVKSRTLKSRLTMGSDWLRARNDVSANATQLYPKAIAEPSKAFLERSLDEAVICDLAYSGVSAEAPLPDGFSLMPTDELHPGLRPFHDPSTGLVRIGSKLKFLAAKSDSGDQIFAFAGTETKPERNRKGTIKADLVQRLGGASNLYIEATGTVAQQLETEPGKLRLIGHSLGGGISQFAGAANIKGNESRLEIGGFNSAGLSTASLAGLGMERLRSATAVTHHVRVQGDPVSPGSAGSIGGYPHPKGALFGTEILNIDPSSGSKIISGRAHGCTKLINELEYVSKSANLVTIRA